MCWVESAHVSPWLPVPIPDFLLGTVHHTIMNASVVSTRTVRPLNTASVPFFLSSQRGGWVLKVSGLCKCWCIGHSCFSEKAFRTLPFPLFPSSWEWFISWPQQEKRPAWGLGPLTSVKGKVTETASVWAPEQKPQASRPSGVEGAGGKAWVFRKVRSLFLRDSVVQLTRRVRGHIYAWFPEHVTVTSAYYGSSGSRPQDLMLLTFFLKRGQAKRLGGPY